MDSALEKVGLYDFFGAFISGMLTVIIYHFLGMPVIFLTEFNENKFIGLLFFLLSSYFIGLVLQEICSTIERADFIEKKIDKLVGRFEFFKFLKSSKVLKLINIFKFRQKACSNFLNFNNTVVENGLELQDFQLLAHTVLHKETNNNTYSNSECEYVYYQCKTYLELQSKSDKVNRINSLYGMSRNFLFALPVGIIVYFYFNFKALNVFVIVALVALTLLFYRRCKRFSEYKVRIILRQYRLLCSR